MARLEDIAIQMLLRVVYLVVSVILILTILFQAFLIAPGDPVYDLYPKGSYELRWILTEELKLNESIPVQYVNFMERMLSGEFFTSIGMNPFTEINDFAFERAGWTALLFGSLVLVSLAVAYAMSRMRYRWMPTVGGRLFEVLSVVLFTIPAAALALIFVVLAGEVDLSIFAAGAAAFFVTVSGLWLITRRACNGVGDAGLARSAPPLAPLNLPLVQVWLAWVMVCTLMAELTAARFDGLGEILWGSLQMRDITAVIVSLYLVSLIVLLSNFTLGVVSLVISAVKSAAESGASVPRPAPPMTSKVEDEQDPGGSSRLMTFLREYRRSRIGMISLVLLIVSVVIAVLAPVLSTVSDPFSFDSLEPSVTSDWRNPHPPSLDESPYTGFTHPLGTDWRGADIYSSMLYGARAFLVNVSVLVALAVLTGVVTWAIVLVLARGLRPLAGLGASICTMAADAVIAMSVVVSFIAAVYVDTYTGNYGREYLLVHASLPFVLLCWAVTVKVMMVRLSSVDRDLLQKSIGPPGVPRSPMSVTLERSLPQVLQTAKFLVVIGLLSLATLEFIGFMDSMEGSWGTMIARAAAYNAFLLGQWWTYLPPMIAIAGLTASVYFVIDTAENALRRMIASPGKIPVNSSSASPQAP